MNKTIGFICPLGKDGSEVKKRSDDIMNNIIIPVASELNYTVKRADEMNGSDIMADICEMLRIVDIVIADLTDFNPNVFYELGLRQATKGKCINIVSYDWFENYSKDTFPFDITYYRAHKYKCKSYEDMNKFKKFIRERILNLENVPYVPLIKLTDSEIAQIYDATIVTRFTKGLKDHYGLSKELFKEPCKTIFLMQRSSSLVLNAEHGWGDEEVFVSSLKEEISKCDRFYHIISLEGIEEHFNRTNSFFPNFGNFRDNLKSDKGRAVMKLNHPKEIPFYLKKLPKDNRNSLFKLDRQARVLICETKGGEVNAVVVQNLGERQTAFQITGRKAYEYLQTCIDFYNQCDYVMWKDVETLYEKYKKLNKNDDT